MKFNKLIILSAALLLAYLAEAQQIPLYSNYYFTPYVYNPAMSGTQGATQLTLLHRRQWTGIQGSPETSALAIDGSLNEEKIGWSVYGFADQTDILKRMALYGNYAYHVKLADNSQLSFGIGAGYLNNTIDINAIRAQQSGDIFTITNGNRGTFDLNAGLSLRIADFQLGASAPQLLGHSISYAETPNRDINYSLLRHYIFNATYDFKFAGDKRVLTPLVMVRAAQYVPIQVDAGLLFRMQEYGYIGAMYRSDYAVTGNLGVNLTEQLTVGYAYDFSLNDYGSDLGTSHEFMLQYRFGSDRRNERLENEIKRLKQDQRQQRDRTEEMVDKKLEEFKDDYKSEVEQQVKEAADEAAERAAQQQGTTGAPATQQQQRTGTGRDQQQTRQTGTGRDQGQQQGQTGTGQGTAGGGQLPSEISPGSRGYYLTAGVFSNKANAERKLRELTNQGVEAGMFQDPGNFYYYVFIRKFDSYQAADAAKSGNLGGTYSGDLWIKVVQ